MQTNRGKLDLLVLARAGVKAAKPPGASVVAKAIAPLVDSSLSTAALRTLVDDAAGRLRERGELDEQRFTPTTAGRARLRSVFGFETTPRWVTFKNKYLVPLSLGLPVDSQPVQKRLATPDGLFGIVLADHHDLPTGNTPTLNQAVDALVWRQLGVETSERLTLGKVKALLVGRALGGDGPVAATKVGRVAASVAAGAKRPTADAVRTALFRRWLAESDNLDVEPAPTLDNARFAEIVRAAARRETNGRFGDRKVFISAVWRGARDQLEAAGVDEADFKHRLLEASRAGLIRLHRADLVGAMDQAEVSASEVQHLNAVYHFVEGEVGDE